MLPNDPLVAASIGSARYGEAKIRGRKDCPV